MSNRMDPKEFALPPRTLLEEVGEDTIAIVMNRKSRIIMADGRKIIEKARKIAAVRPGTILILKTSAPVCSKTIQFLKNEGIKVVSC